MDFLKFLIRIFVILTIPILAAVTTFIYMKSYFFDPVQPDDDNIMLVAIDGSDTSEKIGALLTEKDLLKAGWVLSSLVMLRSGQTQIQAGEYELKRSMTPRQILDKLSSGEVYKRTLQVVEGSTMWEVADKVEEAELMPAKTFLASATDKDLLVRAGITGESFEGYFYPTTYQFSKADPVALIIWRMLEAGENIWKPEFTDRAEELKLSRHEVITLASMVQAETGNALEQPAIAGVFHNRLMNLMRLQSEATVRYGLKEPRSSLTPAELEDATNPYNSFVHYGLPPGPICNPGESAIKAALYYKEHQYLFYLPDGSGGFLFAETLKEYNTLKQKMRSGE